MTLYPIPNAPNYFADNHGNVYSIRREGSSGKFLKQGKDQNGYPYYGLSVNNKYKRFFIHRIIAELFIPNPENKPFVNHIDSNKSNYSISNLEWVTHSENMKHSFDTTNRPRTSKAWIKQQKSGIRKHLRTFTDEDVLKMRGRHLNGESVYSIAKSINRNYWTVHGILIKRKDSNYKIKAV